MTTQLRFDKDFDLDAWLELFYATRYNAWWTRRNAEAALAHRYLVVTAWAGSAMIGTLSVLSDGVNFAVIDDVVVRSSHRERGVGSQMMEQALSRLEPLNLDLIQLYPIPGRESFFERFGFVVQAGAKVMDLTPTRS